MAWYKKKWNSTERYTYDLTQRPTNCLYTNARAYTSQKYVYMKNASSLIIIYIFISILHNIAG